MPKITMLGSVEMQNNRWKYPICILYLILGVLISFVLFQFISSFHVDNLPAIGNSIIQHKSKTKLFSVTYIVVYPVCLFIGSMITGYLCQPYIKSSLSYVCICSGLYMLFLIIPIEIISSLNLLLKFMINPGVLWVASSIGGVYLGKYVSQSVRKVGGVNP